MFGARSVVIAVRNNKSEIKLICIHEKLFIFSVQVQMLLTGSRIILTLRYKKTLNILYGCVCVLNYDFTNP